MRIGSLFSGIGGLELGLERAGLGRVVWQVEVDEWCRKVLARHWPDAERFSDVRTVGSSTLAPVDVICGGFPCQDVSVAGRRAGLDGARSGLWFEFRRIVEELAPRVVIIENVLGLRTSGLSRVLADLAALGFDAEWSDLSAADVGAPHLRRRLFIVATHPERINVREQSGWLGRACRAAAAESRHDGEGRYAADAMRAGPQREVDVAREELPDVAGPRLGGDSADTSRARCEGPKRARVSCEQERIGSPIGGSGRIKGSHRWERAENGAWRPPVSPVRRMGDGIPDRSHGRRLKALGNAVVPQCAEVIGRAIIAAGVAHA